MELFNERYFYDCHEVLEDLWLDNDDSSRQFYQGLIHLATAYQHLFRGNMPGSEQRFASTLEYLGGYPERYEGLQLQSLRDNITKWQNRLDTRGGGVVQYRDAEVPVLALELKRV
ncbi:MAG: DUF309 domain-containing protein [Candidatus Sumerlaeaceae bacterium]